MPRNVEKDIEREQARRECLMEAGFRLFSQCGIESVTLQDIADEAHVGIATLYKYYQNKVNLVVAISAHVWQRVWKECRIRMGDDGLKSLNAYQVIEAYFNLIITLYSQHPEILRFSGYFKSYINMVNDKQVNANEHLDVLAPISELFHTSFEKAKNDKSIRTDIDESTLFTAVAISMLGTAERYALGIVWAGHSDKNYEQELILLKDMILNWLKEN